MLENPSNDVSSVSDVTNLRLAKDLLDISEGLYASPIFDLSSSTCGSTESQAAFVATVEEFVLSQAFLKADRSNA